MRLIDADAQKETINTKRIVGRFNTIQLIDNAPTIELEKVTEAHEDIGYDRGFRDGYAQAVEERTCEWENDEEGRNHEQRY